MSDDANKDVREQVYGGQPPKGAGGALVQLSLEMVLGKLTESMEAIGKHIDRIGQAIVRQRWTPYYYQIRGTVQSDGSKYMYVDLGGPLVGHIWDVRRITVFKNTTTPDATVANVTVMLWKTSGNQSPPNSAGGATFNYAYADEMVLALGTIPNDAEWSAHQLSLRNRERLIGVIVGSSSGDQYIWGGQCEDYPADLGEDLGA